MITSTISYTVVTSQDKRDSLEGTAELISTKKLFEIFLKNLNLKTGESFITVDSVTQI